LKKEPELESIPKLEPAHGLKPKPDFVSQSANEPNPEPMLIRIPEQANELKPEPKREAAVIIHIFILNSI
jgi:hypothetical protein